MGIGPSTKETSLHHFRDPLLEVVAEDTDLDLMGIILVGTPDDNKDKMLVGTRAAVWAEAMRADGVILSSDGWGNSDVDYTNTCEQLGIRGIPVTGLNFSGLNADASGKTVNGEWREYLMGNVKKLIESGKAVLGIEFGSTRIKAVLVE